MGRLPRELRPPWRSVPRLVWTMARADAPTPGQWGAAQAIVTGVLLTAPVVVSAQAVGQLASQDRHALLVVRWGESPRQRLARLTAGAGTIVVSWSLVLVGFWIAVMRTADLVLPAVHPVRSVTADGTAYVAPSTMGKVVLSVVGAVYVALFAVVVSPRWAVFGETLKGLRQKRAARTQHGITRRTSVYLEAYAAWPRGCRHGRALAERARPIAEAAAAATGRPVMVVARNTALVQEYRGLGLTPIEPGSLVLVNGSRVVPGGPV